MNNTNVTQEFNWESFPNTNVPINAQVDNDVKQEVLKVLDRIEECKFSKLGDLIQQLKKEYQ